MARGLLLCGVSFALIALPARVRTQQPDVPPVPVPAVAEKLGITPMPDAPRQLEWGKSATATVTDPKKLVPYGIKGIHEGARVTITCVGLYRVRVEADEIEPVPVRAVVTLKFDPDGSMTPLPEKEKAPTPKPR
jgi:hypothetical protein